MEQNDTSNNNTTTSHAATTPQNTSTEQGLEQPVTRMIPIQLRGLTTRSLPINTKNYYCFSLNTKNGIKYTIVLKPQELVNHNNLQTPKNIEVIKKHFNKLLNEIRNGKYKIVPVKTSQENENDIKELHEASTNKDTFLKNLEKDIVDLKPIPTSKNPSSPQINSPTPPPLPLS